MARRKAERRPGWIPDAGWCCRACQEGHQLQCVATQRIGPVAHRKAAPSSWPGSTRSIKGDTAALIC